MGLYDKIGVSVEGVESSTNSDFFSGSRSFTPEEREKLREILEAGYRGVPRARRRVPKEDQGEVHTIAQGRVWSGRDAKEIGLVDELGGFKRALEIAKEKAGFAADAKVELRIFPEKKPLIQFLLSNLTMGSRARLFDPRELLSRSPILRLAASGAPLVLMPFQLQIH